MPEKKDTSRMVKKTFSVARNKDAADTYIDALKLAGYEEMRGDVDFYLLDRGMYGYRFEKRFQLLIQKPGFIYPHSPTAYFLWDGPEKPLPAACTFVASDGAKKAMEIYSYPYRVEACGFSRCEVKEFKQTQGRNLLFVPARPRVDGGQQRTKDLSAFKFILNHRNSFENITICFTHSLEEIGFSAYESLYRDMGIEFILTNPKIGKPTPEMIERIKHFDLVISCTSVSAFAVALGIPTVFYGESDILTSGNGTVAQHYSLYRDIYEFPLTLEKMSIAEVLAVRDEKNLLVERWKRLNIGENFDAQKFLSIVAEYV